ncbi:hypothetical protein H8356DRAFT_993004 [Neocallimastix lanati (nom. inval.)]|jgi:hypothetical protein|uniref:Sacsin/Nov domain-containing protein n=1 Tax=Neocallimastix californiae TaxID=1754190 RepID=A0A1Y2BXJ5_9FUNG|nr:hypothetical protein H8356DRAFT_993004 [Neocallimastix sp. JGI-2020a]ORY39466.1 hypothetical protein LY90DRAFT_458899 [Neocallimastix californiae]|eukprot:ORY39466.1 hypothetical protein LY90DRAFT_458899 [Neocallimastix californiae]
MTTKSALFTFKDSLLANDTIEEKVEVNQRHLIDKILARYSAEFTVFRELLQNSNDASAEDVEIIFTVEKDPENNKPGITSIEYKNNGKIFREEDWNRLKKIAEGNPDEQKIGFFGVGFYSLFSITEEPFVVSGDAYCGFFWKGDQLFVKKGTVPEEKRTEWTSFLLNLRNPLEIPDTNEFSRFLVTSLGFTSSLKRVKVIVNDEEKIFVNKKSSEPKPLQYPRDKYINKTPNKMFELKEIITRNVQMDIQVKGDLNVFYEENVILPKKIFFGFAGFGFNIPSKNKKPEKFEPIELTHFMKVTTGSFNANLPTAVKREMERTTKKNPPSRTDISILSTNYDEYESSTSIRDKSNIFNNLIPYPDQGKIFIGFPTQQTTGCCIHLLGHLIPTVERESIDFVDSTLARWNQELLCGGYLISRILFEEEMAQISKIYESIPEHDSESINWLLNRTIHNFKSFSYRKSTPSSIVGKIFYNVFFSRCKFPVSILTTKGIVPVNDARLPNKSMRKFIKDIPMVYDRIIDECGDMIETLTEQNLLVKISIEDVFKELKNKTLSQEELIQLMKWWIDYRKKTDVYHSNSELNNFMNLTKITWKDDSPKENGGDQRLIKSTLAYIKYFINPKMIPPDMSLPDNVLPYVISKEFWKSDLENYFGNWNELPLSIWTGYILEKDLFIDDINFIEKVLSIISRGSNSISHEERIQIISYLSSRECIPTQQGLKLPEEAYFPNVNLFEDLPIINLKNPRSVSNNFLKQLGVREHVDLQMIFDRLNTLNWDHIQLIKYLTTVSEKLSNDEWNKLRTAAIFPSEDSEGKQTSRNCASELYFPNDSLRELGVPIISWSKNKKLSKSSDEGKFLSRLGLQEYIPLDILLILISTCEPKKRLIHLDYFLNNFKYYAGQYDPSSVSVPFLPCVDSDELALPYECYYDPSCKIMGYKILISHLKLHAEKLGVKAFPSSREIINNLINNPPSIEKAPEIFSFITQRQSEFTITQWNRLKQSRIIPVLIDKEKKDGKNNTKWVEPYNVYFKGTNQYEEIFEYVDFGPTANIFLQACGVKDEPSISELTIQIIKKPSVFLENHGYEGYLGLLRQIATNMNTFNRTLLNEMKNSAFLLCNVINNEETIIDDDDKTKTENESDALLEARSYDYKLEKASNIYLIDDTILQQIFNPLSAPMETLLENMYSYFGSQWLSKAVQEYWIPKGSPMETTKSKELQELIKERAPLLVYDVQSMKEKGLVSNSQSILKKLKVFEIADIELKRKLNRVEVTQKTSACIVNQARTGLMLLIIRNYDYFDVARVLGQILFKKCGLNDSLLLSTLLSTSLVNLKQKGFPVDRIISSKIKKRNANKTNRLSNSRTNSAHTSNESITEPNPNLNNSQKPLLSSESRNSLNNESKDVQNTFNELGQMFPNLKKDFLLNFIKSKNYKDLQQLCNQLIDMDNNKQLEQYMNSNNQNQSQSQSQNQSQNQSPNLSQTESNNYGNNENNSPSSSHNSLQNDNRKSGLFNKMANSFMKGWKNNHSSKNDLDNTKYKMPGGFDQFDNNNPQLQQQQQQQQQQIPPEPIKQITPDYTKNLKQSLEKAIDLCHSNDDQDINTHIRNPNVPSIEQFKPALHEQCNIIQANQLTLIGSLMDVNIYVEKSIPKDEIYHNITQDMIQSFIIDIILPLGSRVFNLKGKTMHIYYDVEGNVVAFNRNRTLFFNLRYFKGLHYSEQFKNNKEARTEALIYWFMVMCHELAHNFESDHNSTHEFYLSSFAEQYMGKLINLID